MSDKPISPTMHVKIQAPFRTYFDAEAESISAINDTGPFDILRGHKNFMCLLRPGPISVRRPGQPDFAMSVDRGVMHVKADKVIVFLDV